MKLDDLIGCEIEEPLRAWLLRFDSPRAVLANLSQLYAQLETQQIEGAVEDGARLAGPVHIGRGSIVRANSVIYGPAIIAEDVEIGSSVEIAGGSYIGSGSIVLHGATLLHSIVLNFCNIGPGSIVKNTVVGTHVVLGSRCLVGMSSPARHELQLQADGSEANTMIASHCEVGAGSIIESGAILGRGSRVDIGMVVSEHMLPDTILKKRPE